jgi:hypothetical protein
MQYRPETTRTAHRNGRSAQHGRNVLQLRWRCVSGHQEQLASLTRSSSARAGSGSVHGLHAYCLGVSDPTTADKVGITRQP